MQIERILLDLDDTCNFLTMPTLFNVGCPVNPIDNSQYPSEVGYDIVAACNKLHPTKNDWTVQEFWDAVPRNLWAEAPLSQECLFLFMEAAKLVGTENIFIATSPTKDPECLAGKLEWIHDNLFSYMHRQYIITPRKWLCATPGTLLIDDCDENVEKFREAGGQAILVPRPWNSLKHLDTINHLREQFDEKRIFATCQNV